MVSSVIKRDGRVVDFDSEKIVNAIMKAFVEVDHDANEDTLHIVTSIVESIKNNKKSQMSVEEIQDLVEKALMKSSRKDVARAYIRYRYNRELARVTSLDKTILDIINCKSEYHQGENSNKNPRLNTTVRDYMAGAVSTNISAKILIPKDIIDAHNKGIIHWHDGDYSIQKMHNCDLVNLEDMLQNGTVITETMIEKPHSFSTACNIASQIVAQVASSQYGGQSISLAHLAPFVDVSRQHIRKEVIEEHEKIKDIIPNYDSFIDDIVKKRLKKEIEKGIQIIQYQVLTLMTTNGQTPFVTMFMYLNEAKNEQEKEDLAMLIEEVLKQSLQGVKNEEGVWITPVFPKIIYVLQEDNITEDSKYWYLTELSARCSLKRLTPDYISERVMKELKEGNCFPVMG